MTELTLLLLFGVFILFFGTNSKARDIARSTGKRECVNRRFVFLDDSIALKSLKVKTLNGRIGFMRSYEFEFNHFDFQRYQGKIEMFGYLVLSVQFFHPDHIE